MLRKYWRLIGLLVLIALLGIPERSLASTYYDVINTRTNLVIAAGSIVDLPDGYSETIFKIKNTTTNLTIEVSNFRLANNHSSNPFSFVYTPVYTPPATGAKIFPGGSADFKVRFLTSLTGTFTANIFFDGTGGSFFCTLRARQLESGPSIYVDAPSGAGIAKGSTYTVGSTNTNVPLDTTFRIRNAGNQALSLNVGVSSGAFSVPFPPPSSIPAGSSANFTVRLLSSVANTYESTISISNNDPNDNPFTFRVRGTVNAIPAPQIAVTRADGSPVLKGSTVDFGNVPVNTTRELEFFIKNTGTATLNINNPSTFVGGTGFTLGVQPSSSISAGGSSRFTIRFTPPGNSAFTGSASIGNNDAEDNPYVFSLSGFGQHVPTPRISVASDGGSAIPRGDSFNMGSTPVRTPVIRTFRIHNNGDALLNITNISVNSSAFSVSQASSSSIAPGGSATFTVQFNPPGVGGYSGTVSIGNNDPQNNPFTFSVTGTGLGSKIRIVSGDGVTVFNGATYTFPTTTLGTAVSRGFTIFNDGNQPLTISNFTLSGAGFVLRLTPTSPVNPGATTAFRVQVPASSRGTFNGTVTFNTNDPLAPTFTVYLRATVN